MGGIVVKRAVIEHQVHITGGVDDADGTMAPGRIQCIAGSRCQQADPQPTPALLGIPLMICQKQAQHHPEEKTLQGNQFTVNGTQMVQRL